MIVGIASPNYFGNVSLPYCFSVCINVMVLYKYLHLFPFVFYQSFISFQQTIKIPTIYIFFLQAPFNFENIKQYLNGFYIISPNVFNNLLQ